MSDLPLFIEPVPTPDSEPFWAAAAEGRLLLRWCDDCDRSHWYPRPICPLCGSPHTAWRDASGDGEIYSFATMVRAPQPYTIAYVTLAEGPTMMTAILSDDAAALAIGQPVRLRWTDGVGGYRLPCFAPVAA